MSQISPNSGEVPQPDSRALDLAEAPAWMKKDPVWDDLAVSTLTPRRLLPRRLFEFPVTVTGYSSTVDQTDSTPFITASNKRVRPGIVALSRDLLREFTPGAPFSFGDKIELVGVGTFTVEDTMNQRYNKRVDIWFTSRDAARLWGRQKGILAGLRDAGHERGFGSSVAYFAAAHAD